MKTINKLLRYKFNRKERRFLAHEGFINWCWGKWWFNFSDSILYTIKQLKWYNQEFLKKLLLDLELLCWEHDIDFTLWGTKWDFRKANFIFAYKIFKLTSWKRWRHFFGRIWLFLVIYILLNRHGKKYFAFWKKRKLEELFINFNS